MPRFNGMGPAGGDQEQEKGWDLVAEDIAEEEVMPWDMVGILIQFL